jgi:hypothetical protein
MRAAQRKLREVKAAQVERISAESLALLQQTKAQVDAAQIAFQSAINFVFGLHKIGEADSIDLATGIITRGSAKSSGQSSQA